MLLGIGGVRAVRTYCRITGHPAPEVFHTNEGHAGFLGLERIAELCDAGSDFGSALEAVRAGTVFTTHTPVPAGIDRFDRELVARHFGPDAELPRIEVERVLRLGMETYPGGEPNLFNMAVMGLRLAQRANGVSVLHGGVSRGMFAGLWPGFDADEVPITSVTNGVHAPTWVAPEVFRLAPGRSACSGPRTRWPSAVRTAGTRSPTSPTGTSGSCAAPCAPARGGGARAAARLLAAAGRRDGGAGLDRRRPRPGRAHHRLRAARPVVQAPHADAAGPGAADGAAAASRAADPDLVAGKAHPADDGGKRLVQELVRFADDARVRHRIVFLPDYGMAMAQKLYPGCDIWLNNPLRPLEACGTSGMKAALNGCLNLSVLDAGGTSGTSRTSAGRSPPPTAPAPTRTGATP